MFDCMGLSQEEQSEIIEYTFKVKERRRPKTPKVVENIPGVRVRVKEEDSRAQKTITADKFYAVCVKYDLPLFEELELSINEQFNKAISSEMKK